MSTAHLLEGRLELLQVVLLGPEFGEALDLALLLLEELEGGLLGLILQGGDGG